MEKIKKILVLNNEIEARKLEAILITKKIPFFLKSYHDLAYDGLFQMQHGWGHLEAPDDYEELILKIYNEKILNVKKTKK